MKIQNVIKNIIIIIVFMGVMILIPFILDFFVFGNNLKSNLTNSEWAGFLGSYSGSVATLIVLVGTILYTNYCNKQEEKSNYMRNRENIRTQMQPWLDKRINVAKSERDVLGSNDRSFVIEDDRVTEMRFYLRDEDREKMRLHTEEYYCLKYSVVNAGADNAVRMKISLNGFEESYTILKNETINLFLLFNMSNKNYKQMRMIFDYWDVGSIGHYQQIDTILLEYKNEDWTIKPEPISPPKQLNTIRD